MIKYPSLVGLLFVSMIAFGQSPKAIKEQAKAYIAAAHYEDAINVLEANRQLSKKDEEGRFLIAVCLYQLNNLSAAKEFIDGLIRDEKSPYPECWFYLGKIFHAQQQFTEAIQNYKIYLRLLRPDHPNRAMLIQEIKRCDNGLRLRFRETQTVVENLGAQINTKGDEFAPILSPNRSTQLYFSAKRPDNTGGLRDNNGRVDEAYGQALSDMFSSRLSGGQWQAPQALHYLLNTPQNEQLIGFSNNGSVLLYFKGWTWENGEIFADTFQQESQRSLKTTPFIGPAQGNAGEQNLFLYNDTLLIFASRRVGGYGGLDLYQSSFKNDSWSTPQNMGPTINSTFDETSPFLSRDGHSLYFSTNDSRKSVGGLDVVRSVYLDEAKRWSEPGNLGFPINSPSDDAHFILAKDGFTAFLSSARKDGFGQRDLYVTYFTKYRKEMEMPEAVAFSSPSIHTPTPQPINIAPISVPIVSSKKQWSAATNTLHNIGSPPWINEVLEAANQHPQNHIVLTCYLPNIVGEETTKTLFDGIQFLKSINQQLSRGGIASSRVFLRSLVSTTNQYVLNVTMAPQGKGTHPNLPIIGKNDNSSAVLSPVNQTLMYKVQVLSVQRIYSNKQLSQQEFLMLENTANLPHLRYTVGATSNYQQANTLRQRLVSAGYKGAYIIPYLYGERIDKTHAALFVEQFPDLLQYLGR